jgi:hypothetical protein
MKSLSSTTKFGPLVWALAQAGSFAMLNLGVGCASTADTSGTIAAGADYPATTGVRVLAEDIVPANECRGKDVATLPMYAAAVYDNDAFVNAGVFPCTSDVAVRNLPIGSKVRVELARFATADKTILEQATLELRAGRFDAAVANPSFALTRGRTCTATMETDVDAVASCVQVAP